MTAAVAGRAAAAASGGRAAAASGGAAARSSGSARASAIPGREHAGRTGGQSARTSGRRRTPPASDEAPVKDAVAKGGEKPAKPETSGGESADNSRPSINVNIPGPVSSGAGFLLAVVFWGWIALPFLKHGPAGVKNMLRAKFTNKGPDGSYLP